MAKTNSNFKFYTEELQQIWTIKGRVWWTAALFTKWDISLNEGIGCDVPVGQVTNTIISLLIARVAEVKPETENMLFILGWRYFYGCCKESRMVKCDERIWFWYTVVPRRSGTLRDFIVSKGIDDFHCTDFAHYRQRCLVSDVWWDSHNIAIASL